MGAETGERSEKSNYHTHMNASSVKNKFPFCAGIYDMKFPSFPFRFVGHLRSRRGLLFRDERSNFFLRSGGPLHDLLTQSLEHGRG